MLSPQKCDLETGPLREETAEELAMVVSPHPQPRSCRPVPSIEVLSPWRTVPGWGEAATSAQVWSPASTDNCDQTPLLNISSPVSSDAGELTEISLVYYIWRRSLLRDYWDFNCV